jgi:hypothetical protein
MCYDTVQRGAVMNELDEKICAIAERAFPELFSLACDIYDHPETGL